MTDDKKVQFFQGTRVNSVSSPITFQALKAHSEAIHILNARQPVTPEKLFEFMEDSFVEIFKVLAQIEERTRFNVIDETERNNDR